MAVPVGAQRTVYRNRGLWVIAAIFLVFDGIFTILLTIAWWPFGVLVWAAGLASAWWIHRTFVRPRLEVSPEGVTIVNPGQRLHVRWDEIERVVVVQWRLTFLCTDRRAPAARAVSASAIAFMLGRRTYVDRVAQELSTRLVESRDGRWQEVGPAYTVTAGELHRRRQAGVRWTLGVLAVTAVLLLLRSLVFHV